MSVKQEPFDDLSMSRDSSGCTDFVKKLFQMLEDESYKDVVRWTESGDSLVILDTNRLTRDVLPKHFKHSNFASFVRQLNKYDFHKVKRSSAERKDSKHRGVDDTTWEFRHPDFRAHDAVALENIKRKPPLPKKPEEINQKSIVKLEKEVAMLRGELSGLTNSLKSTESKYNTLVESFVHLKSTNDKCVAALAALTQSLAASGIKVPSVEIPSTTVPPIPVVPQAAGLPQSVSPLQTSKPLPPKAQPQLPPKQPQQSKPTLSAISTATSQSPTQPPAPNPFRRPSGSPLHVLLVEDDAVCIQLCRKFLMKYGCTVEVVTDGLAAVSIVEKVKFDLVLMDIVMPNLDGATASSIIRFFDSDTPIIAMTGNVEDSDLRTYLDHGMTDILAKPFSKDDLYQILEKHHMSKKFLPMAPDFNGTAPASGASGSAPAEVFPPPPAPDTTAVNPVVAAPVMDPVVSTVVGTDIVDSELQIPKRQRIQ